MNHPDWLLLDQQLCFRLYAASRAVTRCYQPMLTALDLTYPQYLAMLVLWEQDGLTVKRIGERLMLDSGTLTPLLKRMEQAGYIRRERRIENEREVRVVLTDSGRDLRSKAESIPQQLMQSLSLTPDDVAALRNQLDELLLHASSHEDDAHF